VVSQCGRIGTQVNMCAQTTERESLEKVMNKTNDTEDFDTSSMCFLATTIRRAAVVVRMSTLESESAQAIPAARRPSLLVAARL
jgi:hypothetical protein